MNKKTRRGLMLAGVILIAAFLIRGCPSGDKEPPPAWTPVAPTDGTSAMEAEAFCVTVTGYSSEVRQTDSTPFITAANTRVRPGVLALSRDMLHRYTPGAPFCFGDSVVIDGLGVYVVEDTMHRRWLQRADIWFPSRAEAKRFGCRNLELRRKVR